jgi:hypothetical protein
MAKLDLKFVKLLFVALSLQFAGFFIGTLALGHNDNLSDERQITPRGHQPGLA